ncbi:calcium-binding protein [Paracoccus benzoatiresistens]|uniref:Calcium-binding protein n=1 Tax=Paracoccus benzoatiresistens TaxID=2997341 RepID=A0ABT4J6R4_9RHOB|nr:calcium-binding protein [Paracoccus sp. EF6]MCZ0962773.1 calcium-binding protein [Paracoccus sp. EF6]
MMVVSSYPTTESEPFSITATRDGVQEGTETAYLIVQVSGSSGFAFDDGSYYKTVEIRILDNNLTTGGATNDVLYGTGGADTLTGAAGNDSYHLTPGDRVIEALNGGTDTVHSSMTHTLAANVENLFLTGDAAINGVGNALDNRLTGNESTNRLVGGLGADSLFGKGGNDTLLGGLDNDLLDGGTGNDWLEGGIGVDALRGGVGDDVYILEDAADVISELDGQGTDTVRTAANGSLGAHVENLTLLGKADAWAKGNILDNVLTGNAGANSIEGAAGNDLLAGAAGNDSLDGGTGADTMRGGEGSDTYVVDNLGDRLSEAANHGIDTVQSTTTFHLSANVENLVLMGQTAINGSGNGLNNSLTGNSAANQLVAGAGNDILSGGTGQDSLNGGAGTDVLSGGLDATRDVFIFNALADSATGAGRDRIMDFRSGLDDIDLRGLDANTRLAGNQSFDFSGATADANSVWYVKAGANLIVRADVNGDRLADFEVAVTGQGSLAAGDFLL